MHIGCGALPLMRLDGEASLACLATTLLYTISYGTDYFGVLFYEVFA